MKDEKLNIRKNYTVGFAVFILALIVTLLLFPESSSTFGIKKIAMLAYFVVFMAFVFLKKNK